jgi:uncharacterized repeat protein (TIGR01451 family)
VFTLTATNAGPNDATGVEVTDLLSSGYTYVSDDSGGTYNSGTGVWTLGALAIGVSSTLNITATVDAAGIYNNIAEVTAANEGDPDSTPGNGNPAEDDYAEQATVPTPNADLSLTKTVDDPTPNVGGTVVFTLTVANAGANDATGVEVTDLLPSGYTYVSDDSGGAYDSGTGVWTVGAVAVGVPETLNITATVDAAGIYNNIAEVTASAEPDLDSIPGNGAPAEDDYAEQATTPAGTADLSLTKTVDDPVPNVGSNVVFTLTVTNAGPSDGTGVTVEDVLPAGYSFVGASGPGSYDSGTGVWTVGTVAAAGSIALDITATVNPAGPYDNAAQILTANETDPDSTPGNGTANGEDDAATITPTPVATADLSLTKTVDDPAPNVGSNVVFTLTANNAGPNDATGVAVGDLLPVGYTYVSDDSASTGTSFNSGTGIWTVGTVTASGSVALDITATVNPAGPYANAAQVLTANETDPDSTPGNGNPAEDDYAEQSTAPIPNADLSLTKTVDDPTPNVGGTVVFTLTVANAGANDATGVEVTDL